MILFNSTIASLVHLPGRNPNCRLDERRCSVAMISRRRTISFSRTFPITGNSEIGLYDFGSDFSLPSPLSNTLICSCLYCLGKVFCARQLLNGMRSSYCMTGHASLTIRTLMRSRPGAFLSHNFFIIVSTSSIVNGGVSSVLYIVPV